MEYYRLIINLIAGFLGALARNVVKNNALVLPEIKDGKLIMGFIGCGITGATAGLIPGSTPLTAFAVAYTGMSLISKALPQEVLKTEEKIESVEGKIRRIAKEETVDGDLAVRVAKCESGLNPAAINVNVGGSTDRGLYQINDKYHPEVSIDQAFDVDFSVRFFCRQFKNGMLSDWNASKKCWTA